MRTHYFPGVRVFWLGQEVTSDFISCTRNWNDSRAPSTMELVLASPNNRYVYTVDDLRRQTEANLASAALFADFLATSQSASSARRDELAQVIRSIDQTSTPETAAPQTTVLQPGQLFNPGVSISAAQRAQLEAAVAATRAALESEAVPVQVGVAPEPAGDPVKQAVLEVRRRQGQYVVQTTGNRNAVAEFQPKPGRCMWLAQDPVRVAMRDPATLKWYWAFSGFVSRSTVTTGMNNDQTIRVLLEDVLRIPARARLSFAPGVFNGEALKTNLDAAVLSAMTDGFDDLSLPQLVYTLLFGQAQAGVEVRNPDATIQPITTLTGGQRSYKRFSVNGDTVQSANENAVLGSFDIKKSQQFFFGNETSGEAVGVPVSVDTQLEDYQSFVDTEVTFEDLELMRLPNESEDEATTIEDVVSLIGSQPSKYPVDFGAVYLTVPNFGGAVERSSILLKDIIRSFALGGSYSTRLDYLLDILKRVDFTIFATGRGDICIEFPFYDTVPEDWGQYGSPWQIPSVDIIETSSTQDESKIVNLASTTYHWAEALKSAGTSEVNTVSVSRPSTFPLYGVRYQAVEAFGWVASPEAARLLLEIRLNQANADADNMSVTYVPELSIGPNRPLHVQDQDCMTTVRSSTITLDWNAKSMTMVVGTNYTRRLSQPAIEGRASRVYEDIGLLAAGIWRSE